MVEDEGEDEHCGRQTATPPPMARATVQCVVLSGTLLPMPLVCGTFLSRALLANWPSPNAIKLVALAEALCAPPWLRSHPASVHPLSSALRPRRCQSEGTVAAETFGHPCKRS